MTRAATIDLSSCNASICL